MARLIEITEGRKVYKATEELIKEAKEKGVRSRQMQCSELLCLEHLVC